MANAGPGKIRLFEDFMGAELIIAFSQVVGFVGGGDFKVIGDGVAIGDAGITVLDSDGLSGVGVMTATNEDNKGTHLATTKMFNVALMAPLVAECRLRLVDRDSKAIFMGFSDQNGDDLSISDDLLVGSSASLTFNSSNLVGWYYDEGLNDDNDWHAVFNGGTTTGITVAADINASEDIVADRWQVLRVEVDPNGTARWYINGRLKFTQAGAVSTATDLAATCGLDTRGTTDVELFHLDYFLVTANRDWTV